MYIFFFCNQFKIYNKLNKINIFQINKNKNNKYTIINNNNKKPKIFF